MTANSETDRPNTSRPRWRFLLGTVVIAPLALVILWECAHYVRFGDFFKYGYHADLVLDHSDIGVPDLHTFYCLRVTNYTLHPLQFEGIQLPRGITDGEILYHTRVEKWNEQTDAWLPVYDSAEAKDPSPKAPNTIKSIAPGGSIYPTSCRTVLGYEGVHVGDRLRLVSFTSYSKPQGARGQLAFYSSAFIVRAESQKNVHKPASGPTAGLPDTATTR
jgi:hypothetical protein